MELINKNNRRALKPLTDAQRREIAETLEAATLGDTANTKELVSKAMVLCLVDRERRGSNAT